MERLVKRSLLTTLATLLVAAVVAPDYARADDVVERVVVRNRKYTTWQKFEVTPTVGFSLTNRLTSNMNFQLGLAYNFSEIFALELRPGFNLGSLTEVGEDARDRIFSKGAVGEIESTVDDFPDMWTMEWQALLMPRWTPIYGKLNLVTEVPIHFQAYLTAGGGLRFFLSDLVLLRLELFDMVYPDEYRVGFRRSEAEQEAPGSEPKAGSVETGLTNVLMFNVGASVVF